jgi:hypothetical protein
MLAACANTDVPTPEQTDPSAMGSPSGAATSTPFPVRTDDAANALRDIPLQLPDPASDDCPVTEARRTDIGRIQGLDVFGHEPLFVEGQFPSYDSPDSSGYAYSGMRFIRDELFRTYFFVRGVNVATAERLMFRTGPREIDDELWLLGTNAAQPQPNFENERFWEVDVGVPARGCYVLQADGPGHFGSVVIVFEVP